MTDSRTLFIPEIGTKVVLDEDWTFALYWEHRNARLMKILLNKEYAWNSRNYGQPTDFVTLPKGTELKVNRLYVRNGKANYSSITFAVLGIEDERFFDIKKKSKKLKSVRFWAKLADVNNAKMRVTYDPMAMENE